MSTDNDVEMMKVELARVRAEMEAEREVFHARVRALCQEQVRYRNLKEEVNELAGENICYMNDLAGLKKSNAVLSTANTDLSQRLNEAERERGDARRKVDVVSCDLRSACRDRDYNAKMAHDLAAERDELQTKLAETLAALDRANATRTHYDNVGNTNKEVLRANADLKEQVGSLTKERDGLRKSNATLTAANTMICRTNRELDERVDQLHNKVAEITAEREAEIQQLHSVNADLLNRAELAEHNSATLRKQNTTELALLIAVRDALRRVVVSPMAIPSQPVGATWSAHLVQTQDVQRCQFVLSNIDMELKRTDMTGTWRCTSCGRTNEDQTHPWRWDGTAWGHYCTADNYRMPQPARRIS